MSNRKDDEESLAYARGLYDANATLDSGPLVIKKSKRPKKEPEVAHGDYLQKWLTLKDEIPTLFRTRGGLVERSRRIETFTAKFREVGGYQVVFDNTGRKPKENPNPLNVLLPSGLLYEKCLVADCREAKDNMWAFCVPRNPTKDDPKPPPPRHWHLDEGKRAKMTKLDHLADWIGTLQVVGTDYSVPAADFAGMSELLVGWAGRDEKRRELANAFFADILAAVVGEVKDSTTLQLETEKNGREHQKLVDRLGEVVRQHFEGNNGTVEWEREDYVYRRIPVNVAAQLLTIGFAAEEANRGDFWFRKHVLGQKERDAKRASAYMSGTYFTLRMHTLAGPNQARMSLRA